MTPSVKTIYHQPSPPPAQGDKINLAFRDPVEMLCIVDPDLNDGRNQIYPWQAQILLDFAKPSSDVQPYHGIARCANGAGKDRMILGPCAAWVAGKFPDTSVVITSASGKQLDRQTGNFLNRLLQNINKIVGEDVWKLNYRFYKNLKNGSEINMFATDEAGMAEGWHPVKMGGEFVLLTSETKSLKDEVIQALHRCTGFTKRIDASTPGLPLGYFFDACSNPLYTQYHVTAYDCPHLSKNYIEETKRIYGEHSFLFRSMILAEFGTTDELTVIPYHMLYNLIKLEIPHIEEPFNTAGLDLSAGGDEQVLTVRNGNKIIGTKHYNIQDTTLLVDQLITDFLRFELDKPGSFIFADAGGLGKPIIDNLVRRGWRNVRYMLNNGKPQDEIAYGNFGTELWFNFKSLVEQQSIIIPKTDERLFKQLVSRYYEIRPKIQLESKTQARSRGHPSPDRADSLVLAFFNYHTPDRLKGDAVAKVRLNYGYAYEQAQMEETLPYYKRFNQPVTRNEFTVNKGPSKLALEMLLQDFQLKLKNERN